MEEESFNEINRINLSIKNEVQEIIEKVTEQKKNLRQRNGLSHGELGGSNSFFSSQD